MTTMFDQFFGVPQAAVRMGKMKRLSGLATKLYLALCHESERYRSRELTRTVAQCRELVRGSVNSHAKARRELKDEGLVISEPRGANGFLFVLCNPKTGQPWDGDPKVPIPYRRKGSAPVDTEQDCDTVPPGNRDTPESDSHCSSKPQEAESDFPYGANVPQPDASVQACPEPVPDLTWNDIGNRSEW